MTEYTPQPLPVITGDPFGPDDGEAFFQAVDARRAVAAAQIAEADAVTYASPDGLRSVIICPGPDGYRVSFWQTRNGEPEPTAHTDCATAQRAAQELPDNYQPTAAVKF